MTLEDQLARALREGDREDARALKANGKPKLARVQADYYPTPRRCIEAILPHLPSVGSVLDPCCGKGEILTTIAEMWHNADPDLGGIELDEARAREARFTDGVDGVRHGDALEVDWYPVDLVIMNPPFSHALEFIKRAMETQSKRTTIACLVRLTFLESEERREFHQANPSDVFVFSRRPRFRGDTNGTDSVTAAWLVWGPGRGGRWCVL